MLLIIFTVPLAAQDDERALLALRTDATDLQTGEFYTIRIEVDNVTDLWSATMRIAYDPQQLFIVGTNAGSPIDLGSFLNDGGLVVQNRVDENENFIRFTPSRVAPADPVSGNGVVGEFLIFPLQSGTTTLSFLDGQLSRVIYATDENGERTVGESQEIPFAVTQLTLNVTGDRVTPPPEATATPTPTASLTRIPGTEIPTQTPSPTLAVVEDVTVTPTPAAVVSEDVDTSSNTSMLLTVAIAVAVIAALVLIGMFFVLRTRRSSE